MPNSSKRLHTVGHDSDVRHKPDVHGRGSRRGRRGVLLVQGECVHAGRDAVPGLADGGDLRTGRKRLLLRCIEFNLRQVLFRNGADWSLLDDVQR
jgi:hypothetical protein